MGKTKAPKPEMKFELSENAKKIIDGMEKVKQDLLVLKRSKNSPLVVMREGRIVNLDPYALEEIKAESK
ncbi:MAG: hypothetical protein RIT50_1523 [Bacteroidota bacterium]|jgi:hypothetical protein